jgi:hypothetical protein
MDHADSGRAMTTTSLEWLLDSDPSIRVGPRSSVLRDVLLGGVLLLLAGCTAPRYRSAMPDAQGGIKIETSTGRTVVISRSEGEVEADQVRVAPGGYAVGWLALYPNNATSYPIPLELVVYADGAARRFRGIDLPIWDWQFQSEGRRVAFRQETVHGGIGVHYELHELPDGKLLAEFTPGVDSLGRSLEGGVPDWAHELASKR